MRDKGRSCSGRAPYEPCITAGRERARLRELALTYENLVDDHTRVMLRLKSLLRARGLTAAGKRV